MKAAFGGGVYRELRTRVFLRVHLIADIYYLAKMWIGDFATIIWWGRCRTGVTAALMAEFLKEPWKPGKICQRKREDLGI
jgi:hypothetical protein